MGIRDDALSKCLQLDPKLTLESAKKTIRQHGTVHEQQRELKGEQPSSLGALHRGRRNRRPQGSRPRTPSGKQKATSTPAAQKTPSLKPCTRCGKGTHPKLDTGAEVTAVSQETHQHLGKPPLQTPDKLLCGPCRQPLQVLGQFLGQLTHKAQVSQKQVFVIKGPKTNLLGLPAITALNVAARVDSASCETDIHQRFPKVFEGLGNLGEEFEIRLKPDATPYALFTPRHVPLPLRP